MECPVCTAKLPKSAAYCPACGARTPFGPNYDAYEYDAFISYRHRERDEEVARKLHRAIESYRLPAGVAERFGSKRIGRVFRDQDELPAVGSLPDAIDDALKRSRMLIVVCTPTTKDSAWVRKEVVAFSMYHGRDRIVAAIAEGDTGKSIPPYLAQRGEIANDGKLRDVPAEPLAADFRSESRGDFNCEKLRIVAAIAQCSYDDLVQRDKKRRRGRIFAFAAVLMTIVVALGFLGVNLHTTQQQAALAEARHEAESSLISFNEGRLIDAKQEALNATDAARRAGGVQLVPEVRHALEVSSGIYPTIASAWLPNDSRMLEGAPGSLLITDFGWFYGVVDSNLNVVLYPTITRDVIATCELPLGKANEFDCDPNNWKLYPAGKYIIASNAHPMSSGMFAVFDASTLSKTWETSLYADAVVVSGSSRSGMVASLSAVSGSLVVAAVSIEKNIVGAFPTHAPLQDRADISKPVLGACYEYKGAFAAGSTVAAYDFQDETAMYVTRAAHPNTSSLVWSGGMILVASYEISGEAPMLSVDYSVEAFTPQLEPLWRTDGTYTVDAQGTAMRTTVPNVVPLLSTRELNYPRAFLSAGNSVSVVSSEDGSVQTVYDSRNPIVSFGDIVRVDDEEYTCAVDTDGIATIMKIGADNELFAYPQYSLSLPEPCDKAYFKHDNTLGFQLLALSASEPGRFYSYHTYLDDPNPRLRQNLQKELAEGCTSYSATSDGSFVLGWHDDTGIVSVFDGETLDCVETLDLRAMTGETGETTNFHVYLPNHDPSTIYVLPTSDYDASSEEYVGKSPFFALSEHCPLFAYDLKSQTERAQTNETVSVENPLVSDCRAKIPLNFMTPYGLNVISIRGGYKKETELYLVTLDPITLERKRETPYDSKQNLFAAWSLRDRTLMAYAIYGASYPAEGVLALVDEKGEQLKCDIDRFKPYRLHFGDTSCLAVDDSASTLVVACDDDKLRCFNLPDGTLRWERPFSGRTARVLSFEHKGTRLFAQDESGRCAFIDVRQGETVGASDEAIPLAASGRFSADHNDFFAKCQGADDAVPTTYVLANRNGRIGVASVLEGAAYVSSFEESLVQFTDPTRAVAMRYYPIDTLYDIVHHDVSLDYSGLFAAADEQGGADSQASANSSS